MLELLTAPKKRANLVYVFWFRDVSYSAQVGFLGFNPFARYVVVMKCNFSYSKLYFTCFYLNPCFMTTTNERLKELIQFFQGVSPCCDIVTINGEPVPQGFKVALSVPNVIPILVQQTFTQMSIFIIVNEFVQCL